MQPIVREFIKHGILFSALFSFVIAITLLLVPRRPRGNNFLIVAAIVIGFTQLYSFLSMHGVLMALRWLNFLYVPINSLLGPSCYFFFFVTMDSNYQIDRKKLATFLPGIVGVLLLPLLWLINEEIFPHDPLAYFHNGELSFFDKLFFVAFLYNMVFYYLIYRGGSVVFNFKSLKTTNSARLLLGLFAFIGFINIYGMLVYGLRSEDHLYYCSFTITLLVVVFFIFSQRYNEFFSDLEDAIVSARYKTSQIQDLDLKKTHLRLIELMNNEKLYLEEGLTLKKAADKLNLKTYQLSEFLNKHLGYNFRQFVNNFRVEKAARMLLEDSEANILSVAYQVGFNSKATFNTAFQNLKGMAPSDYIKLKRASYQEG